jgi:MYXO-CTERM domain-containing protein
MNRLSVAGLAALLLLACGPEHETPTESLRTGQPGLRAVGAPADGGLIPYRGGAVLSAAKITLVFWGDGVTSDQRTGTEALYATLTQLDDFDWISEYDTPQQVIHHPSLVGSVIIHPADVWRALPDGGRFLDEGDIVDELGAQIDAGVLPVLGESYLAVYFPPGTLVTDTIDGPGDLSCQPDFSWFAIHDSLVVLEGPVTYGLFPCDEASQSSHGDPPLTPTVAALHELFETITDPYGTGWYYTGQQDIGGSEIGDLCVNLRTTLTLLDGGTLEVQPLWSNRANACLGSEHEFQVELVPAYRPLATNVTFQVETTEPMVPSGPLSWTVSGLPAGVTSLVDGGLAAGVPATLTLQLTAPLNPFQFTIEVRSNRWTASAVGSVFAPAPSPHSPSSAPSSHSPSSGCSQSGGAPGAPLVWLPLLAALLLRRRRRAANGRSRGRSERPGQVGKPLAPTVSAPRRPR